MLVLFFSASPENVLVLVPYFSALALSTKNTNFKCLSTKIQCLSAFSALPPFLLKIMIFGNIKSVLLILRAFHKFLETIMTELKYFIKDNRFNENLSFRNSRQISAF